MAADVRPARASDVDALLAIEEAVFLTDRLSRRSFRRLISRNSATVLVAETSGMVAAYCVLLFRVGTPSARLYSIAAAPSLAGRGIGRDLIDVAERETLARGKHFLRLEVREDNGRAVAIYEKAGFEEVGQVPGYYEDGMTAIRMVKRLTGRTRAAPMQPRRRTSRFHYRPTRLRDEP